MTIPEQWSIDPAENTKQPPMGAPELGVTHDKVSDIFRVAMAGVRECWNRVGTLGLQNRDNVDIRGGTIGKDVTILATVGSTPLADDSKKLGGALPAEVDQRIYNMCWPLGSERGWHSANLTGLVPPGIAATWTVVSVDSLLVTGGSTYQPGTTYGSGTNATTAAGGAISAGTTGGTAVDEFQIGSNLDAQSVTEGAAGGTVRRLARLVPETVGTIPFSGATPHSHSISAVAAHTHGVNLPARYATAWLRRTA